MRGKKTRAFAPVKKNLISSVTDKHGRLPLLPIAALMLSGASFCAYADLDAGVREKANTLPEVEVIGTREKDSYRATNTTTTKTNQDPHDVPQAITTLTQVLLEEQQASSLRDALRNVSGLTFNAAEGGRTGDNMMLRGFYTFGDIYLDGIRDTAQYNRETFYLEQIDVLRGSAAMLFGRGQAGGVINQVAKSPHKTAENEVSISVGSQDYLEAKGDFNLPFGENNGLCINVMNRDEANQRKNSANGDGPELHRRGFAASAGFNIGGVDEFNINYVYTATRDVPDYGVRFDPATRRVSTLFPVNTFWGSENNFDDSDNNIGTLSHLHRFESGAHLKTQVRHADYQRQYWAKTPSGTVAPSPTGGVGGNVTRATDYETTTVQSDFTHGFEALGMKHDVLIGAEFMREDSYRRALLNLGTVDAPRYLPDIENTSVTPSTFVGDTHAVYFQDSIEFIPNWKLLLGARRDELKAEYSSLTSPALSFAEWSIRSGLSWQPDDKTHFYLTHSDSFSPTADLYQLSGGSYPAERSQVLELGAKWLLLGGNLAFRTAIYRADKEWERNTDLESTAAILTKKRRTDGIEFEWVGRITDKWEVFSGISLMDAKILEVAENRNANTGVITYSDPLLIGQQARNTPKYTFNLWTTYAFAKNWKVGLGAEAKDKRLVYSPSTSNASGLFVGGKFDPNTAPAYVRWDAMLSYENASWEARLNLRNLSDEIYFDSLYDNGGFAVPGTRRSLILTAEYKF